MAVAERALPILPAPAACSSSSKAAAASIGTTPPWARCETKRAPLAGWFRQLGACASALAPHAAAVPRRTHPAQLREPACCVPGADLHACIRCCIPCLHPQVAWISAIVGAGCTVIAVTLQWFVIRKRVERDLKLEIEQARARGSG